MTNHQKILCVGYACIDVNYQISKFPQENTKLLVDQYDMCGGGPAANAAVCISKLGGLAEFCGYLGCDAFGNMHHDELSANNVGVTHVRRGSLKTPVVAILANHNGSRTAIAFRSNDYWISPDTFFDLDVNNYGAVLFDGHQPLLTQKLLVDCIENKVPTVLDAGSMNSGTMTSFSIIDCAIASQDFATSMCNSTDIDYCLKHMSYMRKGKLTIITLGSNGAIAKHGEKTYKVDAYNVNVVDSTGAGDAFHGAYALAITKPTHSLEQTLLYCSAVGALACTKLGARISLPTENDVINLMSSQSGVKCAIVT